MSNIITVSDLRKKAPRELVKMQQQLQEQLREKQFEVRSAQLQKVHLIKQLKQSIAKVSTVLREQAIKAKKS